MSKTPFKKKLLKRIFKDKQHEEQITKQDIEKIVIEQTQSAKQIKNLAANIQQNQHKATVGTNDLASHMKHFNYTDKKRQKLTNQYRKQQREYPTLSPLKIAQTITQNLKPLPPYTEKPIAPSANLYPALQANHTDTQLLNPFAPSALSRTLQNLAIPDFSLPKSLSRNKIALKNEITTQEKLLNYYQKITTPHSTKISQLLDKILLLKQLQDILPSFYLDENTLTTDYINLTKTALSPASQSQNTSRAPTPDFSLFTTGSTTHNTPDSKKPISSSPPHLDKRPFHTPPTHPQPSLHSPCLMRTTRPRPKPIFHPKTSQLRFIPKRLLNPLELGDEIQWAHLTQSTLTEFPYIDSKLKLKALTQYLMQHPAAKQAATANLLQAIQDPLHDPLQGFFTWLFQSYSLSRQELNTNLRKAIEQQKFDWSINPAIDLQNAIAKVHMSLVEINKNEIFRETLQDALKVKLHPHYHLVADTPIPKLPEKLRFIWKNIVVTPTSTKNLTSDNESTILNTQARPTSIYESHKLSQDIMLPQTPPKYIDESLIHELKTIREQIDTIHQIQATFNQRSPPETPDALICFHCGKTGHVATSCRYNLHQPLQNQQILNGYPNTSHQNNEQ